MYGKRARHGASEAEVRAGLREIWQAMQSCVRAASARKARCRAACK
jgi:L-serine deaminase